MLIFLSYSILVVTTHLYIYSHPYLFCSSPGINAMLNNLDPYTEYETTKEATAMKESIKGKYGSNSLTYAYLLTHAYSLTHSLTQLGGVGMIIGSEKDKIVVVDAFEPYAYTAGMRAGDVLLKVNDVSTSNTNVNQVQELLRGEPETELTLEYKRGDMVNDLKIQRKNIQLSDVKLATYVGEGVGYINLAGFNSNAGNDFR